MMKTLSYLLSHIPYKQITGETEKPVSAIQYDSRKCTPGSLFAALAGANYDGHGFIGRAIELGATAIVCQRLPDKIIKDVTYILVENTREALALLSHAFYDFPARGMKIIGVTGTNGKTTITFLLKSIFEAAGINAGLIGTTGIFIGNENLTATHTTPESLELCQVFSRMKARGVRAVAMEVSSHALTQSRVAGIDFSVAIFTNLTHEHLDYHPTMEDYARAKKILFGMLDTSGIAIVNGDDPCSSFMLEAVRAAIRFKVGRVIDNDIIIYNEEFSIEGTIFEIRNKSNLLPAIPKYEKITTRLAARFNIDNAALAYTAAAAVGIENETIIKGLATSTGAPGRMQSIRLGSGATAIVDYAHSPDALEKALLACRDLLRQPGFEHGRLICVFGCGGDRDRSKRPLMGKVAASLADYVVITSDNPRTEEPDKIIEQINAGINNNGKTKVVCISNRSEAIRYAAGFAREGDIVLVAGKGHEDYQIIGSCRLRFDDAEEIGKYT